MSSQFCFEKSKPVGAVILFSISELPPDNPCVTPTNLNLKCQSNLQNTAEVLSEFKISTENKHVTNTLSMNETVVRLYCNNELVSLSKSTPCLHVRAFMEAPD